MFLKWCRRNSKQYRHCTWSGSTMFAQTLKIIAVGGHLSHDMTNQQSICPVWSVFAVRMKNAWVLSYPLSAQRRLWASAQSDLSLRWAHRYFAGFVMSRLICFCRIKPDTERVVACNLSQAIFVACNLTVHTVRQIADIFTCKIFPPKTCLEYVEVWCCQWKRKLFWFDFCFTALQHILGHFGRGQLP